MATGVAGHLIWQMNNMKKLYGLILTVFVLSAGAGSLYAQTQDDALTRALAEAQGQTVQPGDSVRVKGVVVDAKDKKPMQAAYVILETEKDTVRALTNPRGEFLFPKVPKGLAKLNISYIGYSTYTLEFKADGVQMDFGEIAMAEGTVELDAVSVVGRIEMMTSRGDTVVYNPAAFKTMEGDYAVDLIVKFPGIEIEDDGTITAHGETVKWALVDGKLMFGRDVMNTIENVKANDIEEVKVYDIVDPDKPGAEYAREQEDMQRVMDFTTKSKFTGVLNARVLGGLGKDLSDETEMTPWGRYKMEGDFGLFNEKRVIHVRALSNNTRDGNSEIMRRFLGGGRGMGYGGGGDGYGRRNNVNIRLSNSNPFIGRGKWQGDLNYSFNNSYDYSYTITEQKGLVDNTLRRDSVQSKNNTNTHNFNIGIYKRWENASLNIDPRFTLGNVNADSYNANWVYEDDQFVRSDVSDGNTKNNSFSTSGTVRFHQAFIRPEVPVDSSLLAAGVEPETRRPITMSISAEWSYSNQNTNGLRDYTQILVNYPDSMALVITDNNGRSNGINSSVSVNGVEITPWMVLRANYSFNHNYTKTLNLYIDEITGEISDGSSQTLTDHTIRNSFGLALSLGKRDSKVSSNLGVNYNATNNMRDEIFPRDIDDRRLFHSFTPYFSVGNFQRNMGAARRYQWSLSYSTGSSNPSLEQLRNFVDITNEMSPVLGNPNLKQSYSHNASASLRIFNNDEATSVNISLSGSYTQDAITTQRTYIERDTTIMGVDIQRGAQLTSYRNVSGAKSASLNTSFSRPFIGNKFVLNAGVRYSFSYRPSYETQYTASSVDPAEQQRVQVLIWNSDHTPSVNVGLRSNHSAVIEYGITNSTSLGYTLTTGTNNFRTIRENVGANFRLRFLKNFTLEGDYAFSYYSRYVGSSKQEPVKTQLLNAALSWDFAKRAGNLRFTVYDILNRNSSFTSSVDSRYLTNTWRQLMGRYCMLTASFRFNKTYGGNGGGESMRGEGPGPDGPPPGGPGPDGPRGPRGGGPRGGMR